MSAAQRARDQVNAMLDGGRPFTISDAESVLKAALDVDELVVVLHDAACTRAGTAHTPQWWENRERSARAVVAHLTKGDENDE